MGRIPAGFSNELNGQYEAGCREMFWPTCWCFDHVSRSMVGLPSGRRPSVAGDHDGDMIVNAENSSQEWRVNRHYWWWCVSGMSEQRNRCVEGMDGVS